MGMFVGVLPRTKSNLVLYLLFCTQMRARSQEEEEVANIPHFHPPFLDITPST